MPGVGREECCSPAGLLDLGVWAAGSQPAIPFISGIVCLLEKNCASSTTQTGTQKIGIEMPR